MNRANKTDYGSAIREGFVYLLNKYPDVFIIGQGLWSPWYVGNTMSELDKIFGVERIIDTLVSESACTGAGVGAAISGMKPIVVHPRMDFMLYAMDSIVNEAAKWFSMMGGQSTAAVTIRAIINRGGEQGAQHSQSLHSWFAHIPGLRVVMPATPVDARNLLIASVLSKDPVMYIDDRWLYSDSELLPDIVELDLASEGPRVTRPGNELTLVGAGYSAKLCSEAAEILEKDGFSIETIDVRVLNPFNPRVIVESVQKTGCLIAVDGGWSNSGFAGEIIASVTEEIEPFYLKISPRRLTLKNAPAPASSILEQNYYTNVEEVIDAVRATLKRVRKEQI